MKRWMPMAWPSAWRKPRQGGVSPATTLAEIHEQALTRSLAQPLVAGNRVDLLQDGPQTYTAMLDAIDAAREHVHIESYIVDADGPGEEFARRLAARSRDGVRVHLLFDSIGSMRTPRAFFESLEREGVLLCEYRPVRSLLALISRKAHRRNHRKIMVVDGRIGFIGGLNISREYAAGSAPGLLASKHAGKDDSSPGWRDSHVRVQGPVVQQLQALFIDHWNRHARVPIAAARHGQATTGAAGTQRAAVASTAGGRTRNPFYRALLAAVDAARERVFITTAYFVPPRRLLRALLGAAERGVDVQLMLPGHSDFWAPLHAGRWHYGRLLRAGVRIHERHDTLLHAKTTVIDGLWSAVGSSNLDWRSTVHNAEANLLVLDDAFAAEVERMFRADVAQCRPVALRQWLQRSLVDRCKEWMARRFEFML
jgi:cardiolipin synthase A/B